MGRNGRFGNHKKRPASQKVYLLEKGIGIPFNLLGPRSAMATILLGGATSTTFEGCHSENIVDVWEDRSNGKESLNGVEFALLSGPYLHTF